ncbi:MAG: hypothetical protein EOO22_21380 [Comamonadaceae bacterium]|nr:MAG: hypothetical protein EOO22_21380 [Comamonadaceae bacterium]
MVTKGQKEDRDNKRAFRWGVGLVILLIIGAVLFNAYWLNKPPANIDNRPASGATTPRPAPEKPPGS